MKRCATMLAVSQRELERFSHRQSESMKRCAAMLTVLMLACHVSSMCAGEALAADSPAADPAAPAPEPLVLHARSRVPASPQGKEDRPIYQTLRWDPQRTAVVICDMWDKHWCPSASARVAEMAPRVDRLIAAARRRGVLIIHCPSGTMDFYADTPQRRRAQQAPPVKTAVPLRGWCPLDEQREGRLPIDDSQGGCDTPGAKSHRAWSRQIETIHIAPEDAVTDSAEAYYLMRQRGIENVLILGVHTNMCVLGRPFGIRQMVLQGMNVLLVRDLTDSMYDPRQRPFVSHFRGTELVIEHIETHWCPTVTSADLLGTPAFRFSGDKRPHVVFLISEDEYEADRTLPAFAVWLRRRVDVYCTVVRGEGRHELPGIEALRTADAAVMFIRRKALPPAEMKILREFVGKGGALVALRTSSHAFSVRGEAPEGLVQWPEFDHDVLGGNYHGHGPNKLPARVTPAPGAGEHPILRHVALEPWQSGGSLYMVEPLVEDATVLLRGTAGETTQPVAWVRTRGGARVFYTSLGHPADFEQEPFRQLLLGAIRWAVNRAVAEISLDPSQ